MNKNWFHCDGHGHNQQQPTLAPLKRRHLLHMAALSGVAWALRPRTALADLTLAPQRAEEERPVLITIFLRGGADGLSIAVPYGEDAYGRNRPTLGIAAPRDKRASERSLDLDGFFGLHPKLASLYPHYKDGSLALVHACGSGDHSRSHFEAASAMERGVCDGRASLTSGWLSRYLDCALAETPSPLRAVAVGNVMPDALRGASNATLLHSLDEYRLQVAEDSARAALHHDLNELYGTSKSEIAEAGRATLRALDALNRVDPVNYRPAHGAVYPATELGTGLRQVACLLKARVGLEVACLDRGGWDTHVAQGGSSGWMGTQLEDVALSIAALTTDLGRSMNRVTIVVMTEFGRRLQENSGLGTDHGRAGAMLLLGGSVRGGKVYSRWPGLEDHQLEPPGDLRVTIDYRDVLGEVVGSLLKAEPRVVFPDYKPNFLGVLANGKV